MLKTVLALAASALSLAPQAFAAPRLARNPAVIEDVKVTPRNAGINPDAFAYRIDGRVLLGGNPCQARGVKATLRTQQLGRTLHVLPTLEEPRPSEPRICTREWNPVYRQVSLTVRGLRSRIADVVVHNIDQLGATSPVSALIDDGRDMLVTGTLTRIMAAGAETTGIAIILSTGSMVEVDLETHKLDRLLNSFENAQVRVSGRLHLVRGVEIPLRQVLVVQKLEPAGA